MDIYSVFRKIVDYTASLLRELYGREDYIEIMVMVLVVMYLGV
jgi:hypothetical protein